MWNFIDYKVQLYNLREGSMSISHTRWCQLITILSLLISSEIEKAHYKCIRDTSFLRSYCKIWRPLISCWTDLTPQDWYIATMFTQTEQQIYQDWHVLDQLNSLITFTARWKWTSISHQRFLAKSTLALKKQPLRAFSKHSVALDSFSII